VRGRPGTLDRRAFLSIAGAAFGAAPFHALACRAARRDVPPSLVDASSSPSRLGYGPLAPVRDDTTRLPLLDLPSGFRYRSFGWIGDPLARGLATPGLHDGMAAFPARGGRVRLVRNHELRAGPAIAPRPIYDRNGCGGTTTVEYDARTGSVTDARVSLAGTAVNCAGGPTPWDSWLTCEETVLGPGGGNDFEEPHGYIFEVPADGRATAAPLRAMGRFVHEAIAVDPDTGIVYETEDQQTAGLYRFLPAEAGNLAAGGRLEMLAVAGAPEADLRAGQGTDDWRDVEWVPIDDPDPPDAGPNSVFAQGRAGGGATFRRLEGIWYGDGRIYVVSTEGGDVRAGQVWEYEPGRERLRLLFESPGPDVLDMPDNLCVSPRGGIVLCEDGRDGNFLRGLRTDGRIFPFARNTVVLDGRPNGIRGDFRSSEFAGATFSPDGRWLFVNVQIPGVTLAITGPWADGAL
jgi:secreted PhoX family phosphatase